MLDWKLLLTEKRRRNTDKNPKDKRTEHIRDYDRIIFSPYFRRLQDKAQVFPLDKDDFVRTRLTHSLEVSTLGKSFGYDVAKTINQKKLYDFKEDDITSIMNILASACLIHDIGNPPFGHFGEESIKIWFKSFFNNYPNVRNQLNKQQIEDFINFEGNAQAFRVVTYNDYLKDKFGLNLTFSTLAASIKYPCSSDSVDKEKGQSYRKFGYFFSEKEVYNEVQGNNGLNNIRHPLAYLMEAADDIAYSIVDIEDSLKKGVVTHECFLDIMNSKLKSNDYTLIEKYKQEIEDTIKDWNESTYRAKSIATSNFRIKIIGKMFRDCVDAFTDNYNSIMKGNLKYSLIDVSKSKDLQNKLKEFAREFVYVDRDVLMLESLGFKVISGLLDIFVPAVLSEDRFTIKKYEGKIYKILSPMLVQQLHKMGDKHSIYERLKLVTDYISAMTDTYALQLFRKLSGIKL